jgi:hypothetical protein
VVVFARRRRAASVAGEGALAADRLPTDPDANTTYLVAPRPAPGDEALVPRWRRPSVVAARFETDNTIVVRAATVDLGAPTRAPLVFADGARVAGDRMRLRFDGVPLLDQPDEALGRIRADLDTGDEVMVLERDELWTSVTTPAGLTGWVPTMVLADASGWVDVHPTPAIRPDPAEPEDEQPSLEVLLAAVAAERRARHELLEATPPAVPANDRSKRKSPAKAPAKPRPGARRAPRSSASPG